MKLLDPEFVRKSYPGLSKHLIRAHQALFKDLDPGSFGLGHQLFLSSYFAYKKWLEDPFYFLTRRRPELFENGHVLDVGACIGYTAEVFARRIREPFRVYAFEPEPNNRRILDYWVQKRGFASRIQTVPAAVGAASGELEIWRNRMHHGDHRVATPDLKRLQPDPADLFRVKQWSLDDFVRANGIAGQIAFVKIDVQGYEIEVLKGLRQTVAANPNLTIAVEYSPDYFRTLGQPEEAFFQILDAFGLSLHWLRKNGTLEPFERARMAGIIGKRGYIDLLCTRRLPYTGPRCIQLGSAPDSDL